MLFVELAVIRWAGANILHLSFFSNFVLLGSFLGIGLGFMRGDAKPDLYPLAMPLLTVLTALAAIVPVQVDRQAAGDLLFFGADKGGLPAWITLPAIFLAVATALMAVGQGVARMFTQLEPLQAYRFDVLGSVVGTGLFALMSFTGAPPLAWFGIVAAGLLGTLPRPDISLLQVVATAVLLLVLAQDARDDQISWSPYYKVQTVHIGDQMGLSVNGIPHQLITTVEARRRSEPFYFLPYEWRTDPPGDVLIVGAGSGTDVAVALESGATSVDAVEIDPRIREIGNQHPDRPYEDDRVSTIIDDGRAYIERTDNLYDTVLFALPDSLTLVSGQSALRLESFLFTREALEAARAHLRPDGVFAMYNFYREEWLIDRLASMLTEVFGEPPCIAVDGTFAMMLAPREEAEVGCETTWTALSGSVPQASTDDFPFLYLRGRTIPTFYLVAVALMFTVSLLAVRVTAGPLRGLRPYADLFFMGVAFLLLETRGVTEQALLFGTTWLVNAIVFAGILLTVYVAIEVALRFTVPRRQYLYPLLFASLAVAWLVPPGDLLALAVVPRLLTSVALMFAPVFIANLIFASRFRATASSTTAFGANLLGAMVGGLLEYTSLVIGFQNLILLTAAAYGLAMLLEPRPRSELSA